MTDFRRFNLDTIDNLKKDLEALKLELPPGVGRPSGICGNLSLNARNPPPVSGAVFKKGRLAAKARGLS